MIGSSFALPMQAQTIATILITPRIAAHIPVTSHPRNGMILGISMIIAAIEILSEFLAWNLVNGVPAMNAIRTPIIPKR